MNGELTLRRSVLKVKGKRVPEPGTKLLALDAVLNGGGRGKQRQHRLRGGGSAAYSNVSAAPCRLYMSQMKRHGRLPV
jgi:hypothetical protein